MVRKAVIGGALKYRKPRFKRLPKNHSAGEVQHYKAILDFSSPHKGFEGRLP